MHEFINECQDINEHCICKKMYSPVLDRQRFCGQCEKWFHEGCMDKIGKPWRLEGGTAGDCLMKVPIIRGWDGDHDAEDWMTVGSGRKLEAVRTNREYIAANSTDVEEEWREWEHLLTREFVLHVRGRKFVRLLCPACFGHL